MGVKEFWNNRSYFQKGAIIGIILGFLVYFGFLIYSIITSPVPIPKTMLISALFSGLMLSAAGGVFFGFFGVLVGVIRREGKINKKIKIVLLFAVTAFFLAHYLSQEYRLLTLILFIMFFAMVLLGIVYLVEFFFKKLRDMGGRPRMSIIVLILVFLIFVILGLYFMYGCSGYYPKDYCEKDSDCRSRGCISCKSTLSSCKNILFKGYVGNAVSQLVTGYSMCLPDQCICFTNRCGIFTEEKKMIRENCESFKDGERYLCYNESGNHLINEGLCPTAGRYEEDCYFQLAKNWYSVGTCEKAGKYKRVCEEELIKILEKSCELINPIGRKRSCYHHLATSILHDEKYCDIMSSYPAGEYAKDNDGCYFNLAKVKPNSSALCDKAGEYKYTCLAMTTGNKELCETPEVYRLFCETSTKETCERVAREFCLEELENYQKTSFKEEYPEGNFKEDIYIFHRVVFEEDCKIINNRYAKSSCYLDLAENLMDSSFCDKIEEVYLKSKCQEQV